MTAEPRQRAGWPVWILFGLGLLAVPIDVILVLIVGGIAAYMTGTGGSGGAAFINAACVVVLALGIGLIAAMAMRRHRLVMALGGLLLAPAVVLGGVLILGLST